MNVIKRIKLPTPKLYKKWGNFFKYLSGSLIAGFTAINSVALMLPPQFNLILGGIIFVTSSAATYCFAQVEEVGKKGEGDMQC